MTRFKFCGLTSSHEIQRATELGASFVGVVVQAPKSHRDLPLERARTLVDGVPEDVGTVLVTPTHDGDALDQATATVGPDVVQVSGDPPPEAVERVRSEHGVATWKSARPMGELDAALAELTELGELHDAVVLDAVRDGYGGHGERIDWSRAADLVDRLGRLPVVLAGGLTPGNVADAIEQVAPWCVDVSTGIETDQTKDPERMRAFARAVRGPEAIG